MATDIDEIADTLSILPTKAALELANHIALPVDQTRDDTLLGASEAAAALGLDKYRSPMSVWLAKRAARAGEPPPPDDKPDFVKEAAEWGRALEPVIRGKYALETKSRVLVPGSSLALAGNDPAWLRCTPDGLVANVGAEPVGYVDEFRNLDAHILGDGFGDVAGLLQVKTASAWKSDEWEDGPPPAYEVQCRVEMAVCDLPWCDLVCLIGGQRYVKHRITRDLAIEQKILTDLRLFWTGVLVGQPPVVDGSDAWNQYASSKMSATKVSIPANDDLRAYLVELRQARIERKRAERQEEEIKVKCLLALSAASATVIDGGDLGSLTAYQNPARMDWHAYADYVVGSLPAAERSKLRSSDDFKKPGKGWAIRTPRSWSQEDE